MCVLIFSTNSAWNISLSKKKWTRYDQNCILILYFTYWWCTVKQKSSLHTLCSEVLFFNPVVYGIMWKNIVDPGRSHMTIRRMRMVGWIQTHTQTRQYLLLFHFNSCLQERASILRLYLHFLSCCNRVQNKRQLGGLWCKWGSNRTMSLARYGETQ